MGCEDWAVGPTVDAWIVSLLFKAKLPSLLTKILSP